MVIHNGDVVCVATLPAKADPPPLVHTNAVLTCSITSQLFEPVAWWHPQILELLGGVDQA